MDPVCKSCGAEWEAGAEKCLVCGHGEAPGGPGMPPMEAWPGLAGIWLTAASTFGITVYLLAIGVYGKAGLGASLLLTASTLLAAPSMLLVIIGRAIHRLVLSVVGGVVLLLSIWMSVGVATGEVRTNAFVAGLVLMLGLVPGGLAWAATRGAVEAYYLFYVFFGLVGAITCAALQSERQVTEQWWAFGVILALGVLGAPRYHAWAKSGGRAEEEPSS